MMLAKLKRQRWWITRVAILPVHMFFYAIAVFFLVRLIPGDPVAEILGSQRVTPQALEAARKTLGLTGSELSQLKTYLGNVVSFKFGNSMITGEPVLHDIGTRLPQTVEIAVIAMVGSVLLTLATAMTVVLRPRSIPARILRPYARAAGAIPDFVLGVAGILLFYSILKLLPAPDGLYDPLLNGPPDITSLPLVDAILGGDWGLASSMISHLVLPELVLILAYAPFLMKLFLRGFEDAVDSAPTLFRVASGASRSAVLLSITRRAAPASIAMLGTLFGYLLGGAVVVEQLFGMPGLGQFGVNAVNTSDLVSIEGFLLVVAGMSLIVFLIVDLVNMFIDPRRRPGLASAGAS